MYSYYYEFRSRICDTLYHRHDVHEKVRHFFFTEDSKLLRYFARVRRAVESGPCETGPDHRHIVIGRDETREARVKGSYHTSVIVPSLGLVNRLESFKPLIHLLPLFFPLRTLCLSPPCPLSLSTRWTFVFYLFNFETHGASASRRPVPFSFPAFIFIIIITVSFVFLFLLLTTVSSFLLSVIIIINGEETSELLRSLRFIVVYLSLV